MESSAKAQMSNNNESTYDFEKDTQEGEKTKRGKRNKNLGKRGEDAAARFLYSRGYQILERNWECYAGEADIIAKDDNCIAFVEVKTRHNCNKGFPSDAVGKEKRERYEKIALAYLEKTDQANMVVRFDVISIIVLAPDKAMIRHHINAFSEM